MSLQRWALPRWFAGAIAGAVLGGLATGCATEDYCHTPEFEGTEVESVTSLDEGGTEVIVTWAPEEDLTDDFFVEHLTSDSADPVVEVLPERRIALTFEGEPVSTVVYLHTVGCQYGDSMAIELALDFDSDEPEATLAVTDSNLGACITISPAESGGGSAFIGVAVVAAIALAAHRRAARCGARA